MYSIWRAVGGGVFKTLGQPVFRLRDLLPTEQKTVLAMARIPFTGTDQQDCMGANMVDVCIQRLNERGESGVKVVRCAHEQPVEAFQQGPVFIGHSLWITSCQQRLNIGILSHTVEQNTGGLAAISLLMQNGDDTFIRSNCVGQLHVANRRTERGGAHHKDKRIGRINTRFDLMPPFGSRRDVIPVDPYLYFALVQALEQLAHKGAVAA